MDLKNYQNEESMEIAICFRPILGDGVNFKKGITGREQLHYYYQNICTAFASIRFLNPNLELVLITTEPPPKAFSDILDYLSVRTRIIEVNFEVGKGFSKNYIGSLFILDCIHTQKVNTLYIDPDTICLSKIDEKSIENEHILVYDSHEFPECKTGIALLEEFTSANLQTGNQKMEYFGGEFYYLPTRSLEPIKERISSLWSLNKQVFEKGKPYLTTEEHFLSIILKDFDNLQKTHSIQRIWTTRRYRNIPKNYSELTFLHLPAEKDRGLSKLFDFLFPEHEIPNFHYLEVKFRKELFRMLYVEISLRNKIQYLIIRLISKLIFSTRS
jgi:hypothetical protein